MHYYFDVSDVNIKENRIFFQKLFQPTVPTLSNKSQIAIAFFLNRVTKGGPAK